MLSSTPVSTRVLHHNMEMLRDPAKNILELDAHWMYMSVFRYGGTCLGNHRHFSYSGEKRAVSQGVAW